MHLLVLFSGISAIFVLHLHWYLMKKIFIIIVAFLGCSNLYGQYKDTAFIYTYGGIQNDVCNQIKPTNDGGYIMIGTSNSFGCGNTDFYAIKVDSVGRHEWSKTYGGLENEEGFSVTQTFDKGYAFVGFTDSYGAGGYDVYLVKTDSQGNFQWQRTYGGSDWDFGYSIQQLPDSGFVICGLTYSYGLGNGNVYVIRTNKNGDTLWTRAIGDSGYYSVGNSICVQEDSLYGIVGNKTLLNSEDTSVYFILMNDKGGVEKHITYGGVHNYFGNSISEAIDHGFIIYGSTDSIKPGKLDEMMIRTDSTGNIMWLQDYASPGIGIGRDAVQTSDNTYISVGTNNSYGLGGYKMHMQHLDKYGYWIAGPSFGGTGNEEGNSIALAKNGNVLFAGATSSLGYTTGLNDVYIVRLKNDSIVQNYTLSLYQYKDTTPCTLGVPLQEPMIVAVKVFPNPVTSLSTILVQAGIGQEYYSYNLYDMSGKCILQKMPLQSVAHGQYIAHIGKGSLATGVYFFVIINQIGLSVATGKIIIE